MEKLKKEKKTEVNPERYQGQNAKIKPERYQGQNAEIKPERYKGQKAEINPERNTVQTREKTKDTQNAQKEAGKIALRGNRGSLDQSRRMSSITRKLHFGLIRRKLGIWIFSDLLLLLFTAAAFLLGLEYSRLSGIADLRLTSRSLSIDKVQRHLWYTVKDSSGKILVQKDITQILIIVCAIVGVILAFQLISLLFSYYGENRRIRKTLNPINEIAMRADELSRLSFSEDKYQVLEEAIEHISPGEAQPLSFQDSDLVGVEAAINNLLIRMRDTYRQQARFVNDASHELRTPIAVIQGYANMLSRWGKDDEKILDESICAIQNEAEHMNHLVEQLLFLARGDSGKTSVRLETVELSDLMEEVYEESFMIDEAHPYRCRKADAPLAVQADAALLKQAVRILIDNAAKYTKPGDEIILGCGRSNAGEAYIQVQDTGIGMEESDVQHMFERFYRSDEVRSYQGTGLGLSIAKWIVDKHGGHFEILSRTVLGTRIRILLPCTESSSSAQQNSAHSQTVSQRSAHS